MANTAIPIYKIQDDGIISVTNTKEVIGTGKDAYVREFIKRDSVDNKITEPDAGRITKFGPIVPAEGDIAEHIRIPATYAAIRLPLYRAGAGTTVVIAPGETILLTPTLSEEVVYYKAACEELGLTFTYGDGQ